MNSLIDQMETDSAAPVSISEESLRTISNLAAEQVRLQELIESREDQLAADKKALALIQEKLLPEALEATGVSSFKLVDGTEVSVKESIHSGITAENREAAHAWLRMEKLDDIIKTKVEIPLGRGQETALATITTYLNSLGVSYKNAESIHPSTLSAFVRKRIAAGLHVPDDLFSIFKKRQAEVTLPQTPKRK